MAGRSYKIPFQEAPSAESHRRIIESIQVLFGGASNVTKNGTLTAGTSTVIEHPSLHENSVISVMPTNADAGSVLTGHYVTTGQRQATITHSTASGTETFAWKAQG